MKKSKGPGFLTLLVYLAVLGGIFVLFGWKVLLVIVLLIMAGLIIILALAFRLGSREAKKRDAEEYQRRAAGQEAVYLFEKQCADKRLVEENRVRTMLSKWGVQSTEELEMITDQGILAEIARTFPYDFCRKAAAEKLTDQILLEDIAETDADLEVRCAAAKRISDQAVLIQIARTSTCPHVRMTVAEKILDQTIAQSVFASVLKQPCAPEDYRVREAALKKLSNSSQALLADIAKHDRDVTIQKAAIEKLTDQKLLAEVARSLGQETFWVCMPFSEALARITDPQIAWEIERERDEIHEDRKRRGIDDGEYQP